MFCVQTIRNAASVGSASENCHFIVRDHRILHANRFYKKNKSNMERHTVIIVSVILFLSLPGAATVCVQHNN